MKILSKKNVTEIQSFKFRLDKKTYWHYKVGFLHGVKVVVKERTTYKSKRVTEKTKIFIMVWLLG